MTWLWISLGVLSVLVSLMFLCMCKVGAAADAWAEREAQRVFGQESRSREAGGSCYEGVRTDGG